MALIRTHRTPTKSTPWRAGRWAFYGALIGLLLALVVFAPARWLASAVAHASGQQVQLHQTKGRVWNGSAQLVLTGGENSRDATALPGRLHWKIRPRWSGASLELLPDCCAESPLQATAQIGWKRLHIAFADHTSRWPANLLQGLGSPWNTLQLDGELSLEFQGYSVQWTNGRASMQGNLQAALRNVSSSLTTLRPMGSYRLVLQGDNGSATLQLLTDQGPLMLTGQGQWAGQRLRFNGEASTSAEYLPVLSNLLSLLGRRNGPRAILSF